MSKNDLESTIQKAYAKIARLYDVWAWLTETRAARIALEFAQIEPGMRILEVATGTGRLFGELLKRNPTGVTIGLDLSPHMLQQARKKWRPGFAGGLVLGSAFQLPFADQQFDLLICNFMIDLLPESDFSRVLEEFRRVLRRPGRLVISYMAPGTKKVHSFWRWVARNYPSLLTGCRPISPEKYLEKTGFRIVALRKISQNTFPEEVLKAEIANHHSA